MQPRCSRTTHVFPGVDVHRCHDLADDHIVIVSGLPTTTVGRTVFDLAAILTRGHLAVVVDELLADRVVTVEALQTVLAEVAKRGKPGVSKLRTVLDTRSPGPDHGTGLERLGARVLLEGGLPMPQFEFPTPWDADRRFDLAYPIGRLAIEWDSRRWHTQVQAFARDRERDRMAVLHGWRVLRLPGRISPSGRTKWSRRFGAHSTSPFLLHKPNRGPASAYIASRTLGSRPITQAARVVPTRSRPRRRPSPPPSPASRRFGGHR